MKKLLIIFILISFSFYIEKDNKFILPVDESLSKKTIEWGVKKRNLDNKPPKEKHDYMLFTTPIGTSLRSFSDGEIISINFDKAKFGNTITIKHDLNIISFYAHLDTILVVPGQKIKCGEIIGKTGISGKTPAPLLYFKVMKDEISVNPRKFLN